MRIHYYTSSTVFLENAIHCSIKHDRFAAEVHQKGMISDQQHSNTISRDAEISETVEIKNRKQCYPGT